MDRRARPGQRSLAMMRRIIFYFTHARIALPWAWRSLMIGFAKESFKRHHRAAQYCIDRVESLTPGRDELTRQLEVELSKQKP